MGAAMCTRSAGGAVSDVPGVNSERQKAKVGFEVWRNASRSSPHGSRDTMGEVTEGARSFGVAS